ncbi:hypothetical protein KI387_024827 [Taxus chinensis]|uniref:Uncharacterized protein n=1 Tax=Taxus chinensis TaxID=29808 RepID=A0AA38G6F1_TAXCH|nr:hypothetical protein KI387_024827 [Taxus chinensis]
MRTFNPGRAGQKYMNRPNQANQENFSQTVRKQMGHLGREYANRPVRQKLGQRDAWDTKSRSG